MSKIKRFLKEEKGVTAIEYGLIAAGIAVGIIAVVFLVGDKISETFQVVATSLPSGS